MNILITGGSKGFGKAIARAFAGDNDRHNFILCARNGSRLQATAEELGNEYPGSLFTFYACDLGIRGDVAAFVEWIASQSFVADVLVNNAGIYMPGSVHNEAEGTLEQLMAVNLYSAYHLTRAVLPSMISKKSGHIFNICSIASQQAYANGGAYSISKYALSGFSVNLREEMKPHNIKVTAVYPGAAYTDSWKGSGVDEQRLMDENDVAQMIVAASKLSPRACVEEIVLRPQLGDL